MSRKQALRHLVDNLDDWPEWTGHERAYPSRCPYHWIKGLGGSNYCAARANAGGQPIHRDEWEAAKKGAA